MASRILLILGLAMAATAVSPTQEELSYEKAVLLAIDLYNREPGVERAFRLLEAKPQPKWDPSLRSIQKLEFTMQETTCPASNPDLDGCDFKGDGVVKECHGSIISEQGVPVVRHHCETVGEGLIRIRRDIQKVKKIKDRGNCNGTCGGKTLPGGGSSIAGVPEGGGHVH